MKYVIAAMALACASTAHAEIVWQNLDSEMTKQDVKAINKGDWETFRVNGITYDVEYNNTGKTLSRVTSHMQGVEPATIEAQLNAQYGKPVVGPIVAVVPTSGNPYTNNATLRMVEWQHGNVRIRLETAVRGENWQTVSWNMPDLKASLKL